MALPGAPGSGYPYDPPDPAGYSPPAPGRFGPPGAASPFTPTISPGNAGFVGTWGGPMMRRLMPGGIGVARSPLAQAGNQPGGMSMDQMGQRYGFGGSTTQPAPNLPGFPGLPSPGQLPGFPTLPGITPPGGPGAPGAPSPDGGPPPYRGPEGPDNPGWWRGDLGSGLNILAALIARAGGQGAFGLNPPQAIMNAQRQQLTSDIGAQERAARLGLQSRGDIDPSTYGFQALQSQLQGQNNASRAMSSADMALRQQQLGFLQALLGQYAGANTQFQVANLNRPPDPGFNWGSLIPRIPGLG